jgi:predicted TIM-barrel fold metal-dependent hydrolase
VSRPAQFGRIHPPDEAWLAKRPPEAILEPDLPIIDTHHHLWERPDHRYLLHEFLDDVRTGHNLIATVFMECHAMYRAGGPEEMRPVGEVEFVAGIAAMSQSGQYGPTRVAAGIVGFADLTLGDRVEPVLEALVRASGGRFRGVRHAAAWDASDVIGNSRTASGPHLMVMKLGGMMMRQASFDYRTEPAPPTSAELAALWRPYIETCIELFGPDRCMFESNFPVDKMGIGWAALWNVFKRIAAGASADEKRAMFAGTARRVYRLN